MVREPLDHREGLVRFVAFVIRFRLPDRGPVGPTKSMSDLPWK